MINVLLPLELRLKVKFNVEPIIGWMPEFANVSENSNAPNRFGSEIPTAGIWFFIHKSLILWTCNDDSSKA